MIRLLQLICILIILHPITLTAQENFENTLSYDESTGSPEASLELISWIAGHWTGEAFGGIVEEVWTPPLGGSMMAAFKLVVEDEVKFYEIETIVEENGTLILRLKHFNDNLFAWEERDVSVDFRLVKVTEDAVYFDGLTFKKINDNQMDVYVVVDMGEVKEEVLFRYFRSQ